MKRNFRLTQTNDFKRAKTKGRSKRNKLAALLYVENDFNNSRVAFVASKTVGNAITRNRAKRMMRECTSKKWNEIKSGWDLIFYARAAGANANYGEWSDAVLELLSNANLIKMTK